MPGVGSECYLLPLRTANYRGQKFFFSSKGNWGQEGALDERRAGRGGAKKGIWGRCDEPREAVRRGDRDDLTKPTR